MNAQELKSYINSALGNSLKLLLPSYWWKKVFGTVVDNVVSKEEIKTINGESIVGEGDISAVPVFSSKEDLEATDTPLGRIASVVSGGSTLAGFEDCYIVTEEDKEGGSISAILSKCTKIDKLAFHMPENYNATSFVIMYLRDITNSFQIELCIAPADDLDPSFIVCTYSTPGSTRYTILYRGDTGYVNNGAIDILNKEIANWDLRLLALSYNDGIITDPQEFKEAAELLNVILSREIIVPYDSVPYIKSENWDRLSKDYIVSSEEGLLKLNADLGSIAKVIEGGIIKEYSWKDVYLPPYPNSEEELIEILNTDNPDKLYKINIKEDAYFNSEYFWAIFLVDYNKYLLGSLECSYGIVYNDDDNLDLFFVETNSEKTNVLELYTESEGINHENIEKVNKILNENNISILCTISDTQDEELAAVLDMCITPTIGKAEKFKGAYIKGDSWEKISTANANNSRELYLWNTNDSGEQTPLTEEQKAYNKESIELFHQGKCRLWTKNVRGFPGIINFTSCFYAKEELFYGLISLSFDDKNNLGVYTLAVSEHGLPLDDGFESIVVDNKLSTTSTNAVQNKVITEYVQQLEARITALENK